MLRDYQVKAVNEIRSNFKAGRKKVLLHMSTGAGKTVIFSHIMKTVAEKGKRVGMVVRGRKLVDQCHKRLLRENVPHGGNDGRTLEQSTQRGGANMFD